MTFPREGGCQCGAVRYVVEAPPKVTFACHCTDCQRRSGGAVVVSMMIPARAFRVTCGTPATQTRTNGIGRALEHRYCRDCGTPLLGVLRGAAPDLYETVRVGTLDDPAGILPDVHCWTRSAQDWMMIPADAPHVFAEGPPQSMLVYGKG